MADTRVNVSRPDGRPEAYDIPSNQPAMPCAVCAAEGKTGLRYKPGEVVMASPIDANDGEAHLVCLGHLPENIVIYNPETDTCRNRDGSYTWRETEGGMAVPYVPPKDARQ